MDETGEEDSRGCGNVEEKSVKGDQMGNILHGTNVSGIPNPATNISISKKSTKIYEDVSKSVSGGTPKAPDTSDISILIPDDAVSDVARAISELKTTSDDTLRPTDITNEDKIIPNHTKETRTILDTKEARPICDNANGAKALSGDMNGPRAVSGNTHASFGSIPTSNSIHGPSALNTEEPLTIQDGPNQSISGSRAIFDFPRAHPTALQAALHLLNSRKLGIDSFYSLHPLSSPKPLYISEVIPQEINPEFQVMDLSGLSCLMKRSGVCFKLWGRRHGAWANVLTLNLDLNRLVRTCESFGKMTDPNTVIFQLSDGLYVLPDSPYAISDPSEASHSIFGRNYSIVRDSCSFDAIMKMGNLQQFIRDVQISKWDQISQIDARLNGEEMIQANTLENSARKVALLKKLVDEEKIRVYGLSETIERARNNIETSRQKFSVRSTIKLNEAKQILAQEREEFGGLLANHHQINEAVPLERSERIAALLRVYPIKKGPEDHRLFNLLVPPDFVKTVVAPFLEMEHVQPSNPHIGVTMGEVDAVLGYIVQILLEIEAVTLIPLRYPLRYMGSKSVVSDPVAAALFPLWFKDSSGGGVAWLKFCRGIFLLYSDIRQVIYALQLPEKDSTDLLGMVKGICDVLRRKDVLGDGDFRISADPRPSVPPSMFAHLVSSSSWGLRLKTYGVE
ncbi:hypothetical protein BABINDRAFT_76071 [Babjeviella inositovora NRRL Y-12698]|uniref:Uncharacterized protein n=1 Tax=Babjeviella inositovora NRRL Y-12698 TaxID=984486 RepID=A0A1E3R057_9ASCO|nr:uncharacterized protein BABINDRAFT_76071 [Babjeviella inositovora NRRL Y-12698]ODQ82747.1 hypothetical protein BABINDRAFT_76071 [Babjeviella inositovora NRRL Y-12698]